jgi:hypothetical protein
MPPMKNFSTSIRLEGSVVGNSCALSGLPPNATEEEICEVYAPCRYYGEANCVACLKRAGL